MIDLLVDLLFYILKLGIFFGLIFLLLNLLTARKQFQQDFSVMTFSEKHQDHQFQLLSKILPKDKFKKVTKQHRQQSEKKFDNTLFVLEYNGDMKASETDYLKQHVNLICTVAQPSDEVLVVVQSPGGLVPQYGYAASQLVRLRDHCHLTVAIDKVGASGGYMMACVAHKIIAAPFAIVGSIGVLGQVPNIHRLLKDNQIDIEEHTAGKYKRSITMLGENTPEKIEKFKEDLSKTHHLFQEFVKQYRPQVNSEALSTGDHFYASAALHEYHLVDELMSSDSYILDKVGKMNVIYLKTESKGHILSKFLQLKASFESWMAQFSFFKPIV